VRTVTERQVPMGSPVALQSEFVRLIEHGWIAIGRGEHERHPLPCLDGAVAHRHVPRCHAGEAFIRRVEPQELLDRVWNELQLRLATKDDFRLESGPILEKSITAMRSYVFEPMQYGRLYLVGDPAHIVPPTGAKGMNLAVADARVLAGALGDWYARGSTDALDAYSAICLRRAWRAEHFSW
jgi:2-polyprenyl-6-methoxyphenol hydroxylase-like FAD-dependent oxidoreductase